MPRPRESYTVRPRRYSDKRTGAPRESRCLYVYLRDHHGIEREVKARPELDAAHYLGRNLAAVVSLRATGQPLTAELRAFIEGQSAELREKLRAWGILAGGAAAGFDPLMVFEKRKGPRSAVEVYAVTGGHVADWRASMEAGELSPAHVSQAVRRAALVIDRCGFAFPGDIDAERVRGFLAELRAAGASARTANIHLASFKSLCGWMVRAGRTSHNPVEHLAPLPDLEPRRKRRALTVAEAGRLLAAARAGETHHGLTGAERALVYRLALGTGLRANEIRTLPRGGFRLGDTIPHVAVTAARAKNRRAAELPLRPELAAELAGYFAERPALPTARAFPGGWGHGADMLRADLDAAGIPYRTAEGAADFHALRHTFGTWLARAGVSPQNCMKLMRQSSIDLTTKLYTHLRLEDSEAAGAMLPEIKAPAAALRTGTDPADVLQAEGGRAESTANSTENPAKPGQNRARFSNAAALDSALKSAVTLSAAGAYPVSGVGAGEGVRTLDPQLGKLDRHGATLPDSATSETDSAESTADSTENPSAIKHDLASGPLAELLSVAEELSREDLAALVEIARRLRRAES